MPGHRPYGSRPGWGKDGEEDGGGTHLLGGVLLEHARAQLARHHLLPAFALPRAGRCLDHVLVPRHLQRHTIPQGLQGASPVPTDRPLPASHRASPPSPRERCTVTPPPPPPAQSPVAAQAAWQRSPAGARCIRHGEQKPVPPHWHTCICTFDSSPASLHSSLLYAGPRETFGRVEVTQSCGTLHGRQNAAAAAAPIAGAVALQGRRDGLD